MQQRIQTLFEAIDAKDSAAFGALLTDDCIFRFGNMPPVEGRSEIEHYVRGFFDSIDALSHRLVDIWTHQNAVVCHGSVTYRRKNRTELQVPFANVLKVRDGAIFEYLIFADVSALYDT